MRQAGWLAAVKAAPLAIGCRDLATFKQPNGHGPGGAGLVGPHGIGAVAGLANGIEGFAGGEVALGDGADLGDRGWAGAPCRACRRA